MEKFREMGTVKSNLKHTHNRSTPYSNLDPPDVKMHIFVQLSANLNVALIIKLDNANLEKLTSSLFDYTTNGVFSTPLR